MSGLLEEDFYGEKIPLGLGLEPAANITFRAKDAFVGERMLALY